MFFPFFFFSLGVNSPTQPNEKSILGCLIPGIPSNGNYQGGIQPYTGNRLHMARQFLVDVSPERRDTMNFQVFVVPTLVRVFIPTHRLVDIDVYLRLSNNTRLDYSNGYTEESIYFVIGSIGNYTLEWLFYAYNGIALPTQSQCVTFTMELEISPTAYYTNSIPVGGLCVPQPTPMPTILGPPFDVAFPITSFPHSVVPSAPIYSTTFTFNLTKTAVLDMDVRYQFGAGPLNLVLTAYLQTGATTTVTKTNYGQIGYNHVSLHLALGAGSYSISLRDAVGAAAPGSALTNFQCSPFELSYLISTEAAVVPCNPDNLPTDLFTVAGGSTDFGGPQAADGTVRIVGTFGMDDRDGKDNYILFYHNSTSPAYLRLFADGGSTDNDIDFFLYANATGPNDLRQYSLTGASTESVVWKLMPQPNLWVLDVYFFRIISRRINACPTFSFAMALRTETRLTQELLCPSPLPVPEVPQASISFRQSQFISGSNYVFTRERIDANTQNRTFTYRITLDVPNGNTTILSIISFEFVANDFHLHLVDASNPNNVLAEGKSAPLLARSSYYNFMNVLHGNIENPGTYYLEIRETGLTNKPFPASLVKCHRFGLYLSGITWGGNGGSTATVESVLPASGQNLDPARDLTIAVSLTETPVVAFSNYSSYDSLAGYLNAFQFAYLFDENVTIGVPRIYPSWASLQSNIFTLTFPAEQFQLGHHYRLDLNVSIGAFVTSSGQRFTDEPRNVRHHYAMDVCTCSGRGECVYNATYNRNFCICNTGYSGFQCDTCAPNYHYIGTTCQPDVQCTQNFCNGHGTCDDSQGFPQCDCDDGYATNSTDPCTICAFGYSGYPVCTMTDNGDTSRSCTAPLLPTTLDLFAYLGFTGEVHLADSYYIDLDNGGHDMEFSLAEDSAVRFYTAPHWIDIDFWLWALNDDGSRQELVNFGIAINTEEIIYEVLRGRSKHTPQRYLFSLRYYFDQASFDPCPTFNFELEIAPLSRLQNERQYMQNRCGSQTVLPSLPAPIPFNVGDSGFHYHPTTPTYFALQPNSSKSFDGSGYVYSWRFAVNPPAGKVAYFHAEVAARFLTSLVEISLEYDSIDDVSPCADSTTCKHSKLAMNRNFIDVVLEAGEYTVWFREPVAQNSTISPCALFQMSLDISYIDTVQDYFYCWGRAMPLSLNDPGFLHAKSGHLHLDDYYLLLENTRTSFKLSTTSLFRLSVRAPTFPLRFIIRRAPQGDIVYDTSNAMNPSIFQTLSQGSYYLDVSTLYVDETTCPTMEIELSIAPSNMSFQNFRCGAGERLPVLPSTARTPFSLIGNDSYYAFLNRRVITQLPMTVDLVSKLDVRLISDFHTAGLQLELVAVSNGSAITLGHQHYNQQWLSETLFRGNYVLRVISVAAQLAVVPQPSNFPSCAQFHLNISLVATHTQSNLTDGCWGEPLPTNLNSLRFLGLAHRFTFQGFFALPSFVAATTADIVVHPRVDSLFRAYSEPHDVDIDLTLYEDLNTLPVVDGGFGFNNEESLSFVLLANHTYTLRLYLFKWSMDLSPCQIANFEFSVEPLTDHTPPTQCANGGANNWPTELPSDPIGSAGYQYRSNLLYYQQRLDTPAEWSSNFSLSVVSNVYIDLGLDFAAGSLVVKIVSAGMDEEIYGMNAPNGQLLRTELEPGNYKLVLYEVNTADPQIMGCSFFSFDIVIEPDTKSSLANPYPYLPPSLDSIAYTTVDNRVHTSGYFVMFETSAFDFIGSGNNDKTTFSVASPSVLRVSLTHFQRGDDLTIVTSLYNSNNQQLITTSKPSFVIPNVPAGTYRIQFQNIAFKRQTTTPDDSLFTWVEIAIEPSSVLKSDLAPFLNANCPTSTTIPQIIPNPTGYFKFYSDEMYISDSDQRSSKTVVSARSFVLNTTSNVFMQVQSQFMLFDAEIHINGTRASNGELIEVWSKRRTNMNEIDVALPAGSYIVEVVQPVVADGSFLIPPTPYCVPWAFKIQIQDLNGAEHSDCAVFDSLPWNLNSRTGGSVPYGGPIDKSGSIHFMSHRFLIPPNVASERFTVNVTKFSILSIFATQPNFGNIQFTVQTQTSMRLVINPIAVMSLSSPWERQQLYVLNATSSKQDGMSYEVLVHYSNVIGTSACSTYGLQVDLQPVERVFSQMTCESLGSDYIANLPAPKTNPTIAADGTYSEYLHSYFPSTRFNQTGSPSFSHKITFTITQQKSRLITSIGYDPLATLLEFSLYKYSSTNRWLLRQNARADMQNKAGETSLSREIDAMVEPGTYQLEIRQKERLHYRRNANSTTVWCLPFVYSINVLTTDSSPFVVDVEPSLEEGLSPYSDLVLDIAFSAGVYIGGSPVSGTALATQLASQFFVSAISGEQSGNTYATVATGRGSFWRLTFTASPFISRATYKLNLAQNTILTDSQGSRVRMISTNTYKMLDTACNNHGQYLSEEKYCLCDVGYAGLECTLCDSRYINTATQPNQLNCTLRLSDKCLVDTCGCRPNIRPCSPLGTCNATNGACSCPIGYTGDHCEKCANGYTWVANQGCVKNGDCPMCVHGACDVATKKCVCDGHWDGRTCDECAVGWQGINCNDPASVVTTAPPTSGLSSDDSGSGAAGVFKLIAIILALFVILATIGFVIYRRYAKQRAHEYAQVDLGLEDMNDADT